MSLEFVDRCHLCNKSKTTCIEREGLGIVYIEQIRAYTCEACFRADPFSLRHYPKQIYFKGIKLDFEKPWLPQIKEIVKKESQQ